MKINFFKKEKKFAKGRLYISPRLAWNYILIVSFAIILTSFIFGLYLYLSIKKEPEPGVLENINAEINRNKINEALKYFRQREARSKEILNSPSPLQDPSI